MVQKDEILRPIMGYEGIYYVSNLGNVYSRHKYRDGKRMRKLKPFRRAQGRYLCVSLYKDGVRKDFDIHVLVAMAFLGKRPEGMVIDHVNNCCTDNFASNIRYCPNRENVVKGYYEGAGARLCHRVRIEADGLEISFTAYSVHEAARQTGIPRRTLGHRLKRSPVCHDEKRGLTFILQEGRLTPAP